jgi:hypothetical protein
MFELLRVDNSVFLSCLTSGLDAAGIPWFLFDEHTSSAYGGALPAVVQRLMVAEDDAERSLDVLREVTAWCKAGD